jgi:hypothetical protein
VVTGADSFWYFPEQFVAYWAVDPGPLGDDDAKIKALGAAALRGMIGHAVNIEGGSSVADALLRGKVLGDAPYRVCLLELEGETAAPKDKKTEPAMKPTKFGAVIEIRKAAKDGGHDRFAAAMEGALAEDARADGGRPRDRKKVTLSGGVEAQLSSAGGAEWRDVAWASLPEMFVVGIGRGSLEKWIGGKATFGKGAAWIGQRNLVAGRRGKGTRVFEAYVDLNALRAGVPEEFLRGRLEPLVEAWHIPNDRTFMVHGTLMDGGKGAKPAVEAPLLALDVSWSSRAEKPGLWKSVALSEGKWPESLAGVTKPASGWAVLTRASLPTWIAMGADTYEALGPAEFAVVRDRWEKRMMPVVEKIVPRIGEWVLVRPEEIYISVKPVTGQDRLGMDLRALFSSMEPVVGFAGKSWSLRTEGDEELAGFSWRVSEDGKGVVGGWGVEKGKGKK